MKKYLVVRVHLLLSSVRLFCATDIAGKFMDSVACIFSKTGWKYGACS